MRGLWTSPPRVAALALALGLCALLVGCGDDPDPATPAPCGGACPLGTACSPVSDRCEATSDNAGTNNENNSNSDDNNINNTNNSSNNDNNAVNNNPGVECAQDADCPAGAWCDVVSASIANCLPGCRGDDACEPNQTCALSTHTCVDVEGYCDDTGVGDTCAQGAFCCPRESHCDLEARRCVEGCVSDAQCRFDLPCIVARQGCGCAADAECGDNSVCQDQRCVAVACSPDAQEPNNDALTARRLPAVFGAPQTLDGLKFCPGDLDFFALWLLPGVELSGALALGEGVGDVRWTWRAPDGRRIVNGADAAPFSFTSEATGLHTLELEYRSDTAQRPYTLTWTLEDAGVACDPDGSPSGSWRLGLEDQLQIGPAALCDGQEDLYPVAMERPGQSLEIRLTRTDQIVQTLAEVAILDGDTVLAEVSGAEFTLDLAPTIVPNNPVVRVRVADGGTPLGLRYRLSLSASRGMSDEVCFDDDNEDDDSAEAATPLSAGQLGGRKICASDPGDWYALEVEAHEAVSLDLLYEGGEVPQVALWQPDGRRIAGQPAQCGAGVPCVRFERLTSSEAGTWFVEVRTAQANVDYELVVVLAQACDPAPGQWVAGCQCAPDPRDAPYADEPGSVPLGVPAPLDGAPDRIALGTLCASDAADAIPLWAPPGVGLLARVERTGGTGAATARLRDASNTLVATGPLGMTLEAPAAPGFRRFTLEIVSSGQGALGYEASAALVPEPTLATCLDDAFEAESRDRHFDLGPAYGRWTLLEPGVICRDDTDRYRFTTLQGGDGLTLTLRPLWPTDQRIKLRLLRPGATPAQDALLGEAEDLGGLARLTFEALPLGQYVIEVDTTLTSPTFGVGYRLEGELLRPPGDCANEPGEPNDTLDAARVLRDGWSYGSVLCRQTDTEDVHAIVVEAGERVEVRYEGAGGAQVSLRDPDGVEQAGRSAARCGPGLVCVEFGPIDATAANAGRWGLEVRAELSFQDIPYRVEVTSAPICTGTTWVDGCVCLDDDLAPNSTRDQAALLPISLTDRSVQGLTLCGDAEDWFRFEGNAQGRQLTLSFTQTRPEALMIVQVYGGVLGNTLLEEFVAQGELTLDNLRFADLWVRVLHAGSGVGYDLTWRFAPIPVCNNDDAEPNDDPALLIEYVSIGDNGEAIFERGRLCGPSDEDWYRVELQGFDDDLIVRLDRHEATMELRDAFPEFNDYLDDGIEEQAVEIEVFDDGLRPIGRVESVEQHVELTLTGVQFGGYWARVRVAQPVVSSAAPLYTLTLQHQTGSGQACMDDALEDNDAMADAARLTIADGEERYRATGLISCGGGFDQSDWYRVALDAGVPLRVELSASNLDALTLRLLDPAGEPVDEATVRSPCEAYARCLGAALTPEAGGDWFVLVQRRDEAALPRNMSYELTLQRPLPDP